MCNVYCAMCMAHKCKPTEKKKKMKKKKRETSKNKIGNGGGGDDNRMKFCTSMENITIFFN